MTKMILNLMFGLILGLLLVISVLVIQDKICDYKMSQHRKEMDVLYKKLIKEVGGIDALYPKSNPIDSLLKDWGSMFIDANGKAHFYE